MAVKFKTEDEVGLIKESADILGRAHAEVAKVLAPGITTNKLDSIAEEFIRDHGGVPSFKHYNGFPATLCISVNENVVHGFPGEYELQDGDIISVDCGVKYKGFHSDSAYTYPIGNVSDEVMSLLRVTRESLYKGIEAAVYGKSIGDIGYAVQSYVEDLGYSVVRELVGHGVGTELHEDPQVPNYGRRGQGKRLKEGLVIAIEPMINLGTKHVVQESDGWTIRTKDRKPSAHFEHMIAVWKDKTEILTTHKYIEEIVKF